MPVTHGVTGSSPVRTAKSGSRLASFFCAYMSLTRAPWGQGYSATPHQATQVESRTHRKIRKPIGFLLTVVINRTHLYYGFLFNGLFYPPYIKRYGALCPERWGTDIYGIVEPIVLALLRGLKLWRSLEIEGAFARSILS